MTQVTLQSKELEMASTGLAFDARKGQEPGGLRISHEQRTDEMHRAVLAEVQSRVRQNDAIAEGTRMSTAWGLIEKADQCKDENLRKQLVAAAERILAVIPTC